MHRNRKHPRTPGAASCRIPAPRGAGTSEHRPYSGHKARVQATMRKTTTCASAQFTRRQVFVSDSFPTHVGAPFGPLPLRITIAS